MTTYIEELFGSANRRVVVTGGGGTLGGAIAEGFARAGATVVLWGRTQDKLSARADRIRAAVGPTAEVETVAADLTIESEVERAIEATLGRVGEFHVLVNACGGNRGRRPLADSDDADYMAVLRLNLMAGCLLPMKHAVRRWIDDGTRGSIINLASMAAHRPLSGVGAYAASKAGVINATQGAAAELAQHGIRVNAISPGFFLAEQNRALLVDAATGEPTERGRAVVERTPFGRFGDPEELAGVCLFLANEKASGFVTGATIAVDGGYLVDNI